MHVHSGLKKYRANGTRISLFVGLFSLFIVEYLTVQFSVPFSSFYSEYASQQQYVLVTLRPLFAAIAAIQANSALECL